MVSSSEDFFQDMIDKLSILNEEISKRSFLEDICRFFDISHAFIYESDYTGEFFKKEFFEIVANCPLPEKINLKEEFGLEVFSELCSQKVVLYSEDNENNTIQARLASLFNINVFVFIPILNQHYELAGFVGLGDRRKKVRHGKAEITKACSLLNILANAIKLEMFQKGIANTEAALSNVLDHLGIDIYVNDYYTHDVLYVNKSMAAPYGGIDRMIGKKCWKVLFPEKKEPCEFCPQPKLLDEHGQLNRTYQWDYERPFDKSWFRVLSSSFPWKDGRIAHLVASVDITESKKNQMVIEKLAQYDHLTGLANRRSLHDDVQRFIEDKTAFGEKWYVLFCDLDGFKSVNDTFGHEAGDVLLKSIAQDLSAMCTDFMKAYRQGGDEFVFLIKDMDSVDFIVNIISGLFVIFQRRYQFNGNDIGCGCSIGVAHYPNDATTSKEIFHLADTAMYCVKQEGRGSVRFYHEGKYLKMDEYFTIKNSVNAFCVHL